MKQEHRVATLALSTMACARMKDPSECIEFLQSLGAPPLELDFHLSSDLLSAILHEVDAGQLSVATVHNCNPKFVGTKQRYNTGLADLDPIVRNTAINDFKYSLDLAARCGVQFCVGPLGRIEPAIEEENRLRSLYRSGQRSSEFEQAREKVIEARAARVAPHMDAIRKSLEQLAPYCQELGVQFVPENRYEYGKLGLPDEIRQLQSEFPGVIGYCHDFGHAMSVDSLGLWPDDDPLLPSLPVDIWHINDFEVATLIDHLPLGRGDLPIADVEQAVLSSGSVAVVEIRPHHSKEEIQAALDEVGAWLQPKGTVSASEIHA